MSAISQFFPSGGSGGPRMDLGKAGEHRSGRMAASMSVSGRTIRLTVKVDLFTPMVTYMKVSGETIWPTEEEFTNTCLVPNT